MITNWDHKTERSPKNVAEIAGCWGCEHRSRKRLFCIPRKPISPLKNICELLVHFRSATVPTLMFFSAPNDSPNPTEASGYPINHSRSWLCHGTANDSHSATFLCRDCAFRYAPASGVLALRGATGTHWDGWRAFSVAVPALWGVPSP